MEKAPTLWVPEGGGYGLFGSQVYGSRASGFERMGFWGLGLLGVDGLGLDRRKVKAQAKCLANPA